jgi:hypothetical protein
VVTDGAAAADGAASRAVGAGAPITVTGHGFAPGERVTLRLAGTGAVLARGTAGSDGVVALRLTVPARASGPTGVDVVGDRSQDAARLQLQVAALRQPLAAAERGGGTAGVAPAAALAALLAAGAGLVVTARGAGGRRGGPTAGG